MAKQPLSPLSSIDIMSGTGEGEGARPEPASPGVKPIHARERHLRITMSLRLKVQDHTDLKRISHETNRSMQEFVDEAIHEWLAARGKR